MTSGHLRRWRRFETALVVAAIPSLGAVGWWALRPLDAQVVAMPEVPSVAAAPAREREAIPLEAFSDLVATKPAVPKVPVPPVTPPPSVAHGATDTVGGIELLGIVREESGFKAAVYVAEIDEVVVVGPEESAGRFVVRKVDETSVEVLDGRTVRTLRLRNAGRP